MDLLRYFHTARHLKPVQIHGRVLFKLRRPAPRLGPAPPARRPSGPWAAPARRRPSLTGPDRCRFLNEERGVAGPSAWNDPAAAKLWLYNLHYFDDLNAADAAARTAWHRPLIARWIGENPPGLGNGWEPYPTSLRIVNWIKWALAGNRLEDGWLHSLAVQARWLAGRLERHLLGNHLFVNAKALVFAGLFFEGAEAAAWLDEGMAILEREIPEQILPDGGQFELSPLYHALALEDLLDLANLAAAFGDALPGRWRGLAESWPGTAAGMRRWLAGMCHPDGEIAFFNDAAAGVAPGPAELESYAARLGLPPLPAWPDGLAHFAGSGYLRVQRGGMVALLDAAPVGPDYLPGHAHADTLSFELSLAGRRVLVNAGTSRYGAGPQRLRERGTAAHNTVQIDGEDSSEVWGGFRVARRARPFGLRVGEEGGWPAVACAHDGYRRLPGRPVHRREWRFFEGGLEIADTVEGRFKEAVGRLHFHPALAVEAEGAEGRAALPGGPVLRWRAEGAACRLAWAQYHPEFGLAEPCRCLETRFAGPRCTIRLTWN